MMAHIVPLMTRAVIRPSLGLPTELTQGAKIIGNNPNAGDLSIAEGQDVNAADLHLGSGWRDRSNRGVVRTRVPAMHDEGDCDTVLAVDKLKHFSLEAGKGLVQGAGPGREISQ
jgi:hypothetical protein